MSFAQQLQRRKNAYRNPVYVVYVFAGLLLFLLGALIASGGVGPIETALFTVFNRLPSWLTGIFLILSFPGTLAAVLLVALVALTRKHYVNSLKILIGGISAFSVAFLLKQLAIRARPIELLSNVDVREYSIGTNGFPSGHVATATALAVITYQYVPSKYHKYITWSVIGVAASRLYLGVHLPADLLGGFAVGLICGSISALIFGTMREVSISSKTLEHKMSSAGVQVARVKQAGVDARGSKPFFVTLKDGSKLFVKVVDRDNNLADWLFKLWRKVIYRRLEDEVPFLTPKRQLEHESYIAGLALANGIRTPKIIGVFHVGNNIWAQAQQAIDGKSLDSVKKRQIDDTILQNTWRLVHKLHRARIVHRDLRAANIFLDTKGQPWLIDFGFSEASSPKHAAVRDNVELLASLASLVGVKRSVAAAQAVIGGEGLQAALPYVSYSILSSATAKELKRRKNLLSELRQEIQQVTGQDKVIYKRTTRFTR